MSEDDLVMQKNGSAVAAVNFLNYLLIVAQYTQIEYLKFNFSPPLHSILNAPHPPSG